MTYQSLGDRNSSNLHQAKSWYQELFHSLEQGFCILEIVYDNNNLAVDYRFLEVNASFERHTGLKSPVGKTARELVPDLEMAWVEKYAAVAETGQTLIFEQGSVAMGRWFEVNAIRIGEISGRTVALMFNDITQRRQAELALEASQAHLLEINEAQKRFVSDSAHELRTPLTSIRGNLGLLLRHPEIEFSERNQMLTDARNETDRLSRLISDLLSLARGYSTQSSEFTPIRFDTLIGEVIRVARHLSAEHQIHCETLPAVKILGDADRHKQMALVLLENAVKYTPIGGSIKLTMFHDQHWVEWRVTDTGYGIPDLHLERVFERYYRADQAATNGTGLGLPIARQIALAHHGTVHLESVLNQGTSAVVRLPLAKTKH